MLERGREFLPGDFPESAVQASRETQVSGAHGRVGSATALFDVRVGDDIHVMMACGLGGTSLINANVCLAPDARVFDDAAWPAGVRRDGLLAEGFVRARHMLRPEVSRNTQSYEKVRALRLAASAFDRPISAIPLHVVYESGPNAAGVHQEACKECGDCCGGCNVGAKTTVASTYIADAATFGAEVFTGVRVLAVSKDAQGGWRVWAMPTEGRQLARPQVFRHRRYRGARSRDARLDRDPAALAGRGAGAVALGREPVHVERGCHRARLQQ
ncbi:MAG: GMC family oxidoreductase N-terminal domain-containing protein [Hyphomicrobium sp.]